MERLKKHFDEQFFFCKELRARRRLFRWYSPGRALNWGYDLLSGYGQSIARPSLFLLLLWLGSGAIFKFDPTQKAKTLSTIEAANVQTSALGRLLAVVENYPLLKANEQFNRLMDELSGTENRIAVERMRYNERVQEYNTSTRQFPANVTAAIFGFDQYPFFEVPAEAKQVPKVNFGTP